MSRNCGCLVTWFCYQLIAKPGNNTAAVLWHDPYTCRSHCFHGVHASKYIEAPHVHIAYLIWGSIRWLTARLSIFHRKRGHFRYPTLWAMSCYCTFANYLVTYGYKLWWHIPICGHLKMVPNGTCHDDVIKWKHFPRYWLFVGGIHRSPVNSYHKDQWRGALMFSFIYAWINGWINNRDVCLFIIKTEYRKHCKFDEIFVTVCTENFILTTGGPARNRNHR